MRLIFVGSLEKCLKDYDTIWDNLKSLIKTLASKDVEFVIRHSKEESTEKVSIDLLVNEALEEFCKDGNHLPKNSLIVFKEPGIVSEFKIATPHITHSATTSFRLEFYKELLGLVDIVIGVGGEFGLLRLLMVCEWTKKPILLLPGSGGTTDFLWQDFFKKAYQITLFTQKERLQLSQTPLINEISPNYSDTIYSLIHLVKEGVEKGYKKQSEFITPDNISFSNAFASIRKFSLALWVLIISFLISLCSIAYYLGSENKANSLKNGSDQNIHREVL